MYRLAANLVYPGILIGRMGQSVAKHAQMFLVAHFFGLQYLLFDLILFMYNAWYSDLKFHFKMRQLDRSLCEKFHIGSTKKW